MIVLGIYGAFGWEANESHDTDGDADDPWVHDSGATLFINGKHICSISEERLTRVKREGNYPTNAINYCLSEGNITAEDVEYINIPTMSNYLFWRNFHGDEVTNIIKKKKKFSKCKDRICICDHIAYACSSIFTSDFNDSLFYNYRWIRIYCF